VMMLDNWDANTTTFQLNWNLTNGATLDCTPPLPVTMSSFVNTCVDGKTLLKWTTETETNNDYFAIEKSDEKFQFYEIGRVSGNGNSNVTNSYSFVDDFYNDKTAYYRIKQVDYNGEFMYHRIIASSCFKDEFEVVNQQLMANSLDLIINSVQDEKILVQLFDIHGKLIVESSEQLKLGNNKITLDNFNINSGIYLVNLVGEIHHYQNKLFRK
ncbi:MAG TPA: T9SS type A sorting domain-containing protein, partial [Vicingus sp.]|nr:T9SS type A sorting domain-containing protein [Vicingus sp.]